MTDPEQLYAELTSGDPGPVRGDAGTLESTLTRLDATADMVAEAASAPTWDSTAAFAFQLRAASLVTGVRANQATVSRAGVCLAMAASSYDAMVARADTVIAFWRNRPADLTPIFEAILRFTVVGQLRAAGASHSQRLSVLASVAKGEEPDLDDLGEDTREWVEHGREQTEEWLKDNGSGLGPLIPNTLATGDHRGAIPQGLGYDPRTGLLLQSYYTENPDGSSLSLIDEATGREITNVNLGGYENRLGEPVGPSFPDHSGGVTVRGDSVYVASSSPPQIVRYSLDDLRKANPGDTVPASGPPIDVPAAEKASYTAVDDEGRLYVGDFGNDTMYVYEKRDGHWVNTGSVDTPANTQGVVVRDGEYVFSTSHGRDNGASLVVQDRESGERSDPYDLPNMSEGIVEIDGEIITTYESGAEKYDHPASPWSWLPGVSDEDDLWAMQYMTGTPLSELGLTDDLDVVPHTLREAARDLDTASSRLGRIAADVQSVKVQAHLFGEVPAAGPFARAVNSLVKSSARSLRTGSTAMTTAADGLVAASRMYDASDTATGRAMDATNPEGG